GNWGPPPNNQTNLEFHEDGSITSDVFLLQEIKRYEVVNDSAVAFYNANDQPYTMGFVLKGNSLELKPICSEGCGLRFKRK
ncbi:MAG TPA: hypothetical protein VD996_01435, partial [Chitinophagaceae bacterium]|nr:hypothetical protein [Chitinophagaceae bacterium]